jgi:hypothetical protein
MTFFIFRCLPGADNPYHILLNLGMNDVKKAIQAGISNKDEAIRVERIGIVSRQGICKSGRRFFEGHTVLFEIRLGFSRTPDKPHNSYCITFMNGSAASVDLDFRKR